MLVEKKAIHLGIDAINLIKDNKIKYMGKHFTDCSIFGAGTTDIQVSGCIFQNCRFDCAFFDNNTFSDSTFIECVFDKSIWSDIVFTYCAFIRCKIVDDYSMENIRFNNCHFISTLFGDKKPQKYIDSLIFDQCVFRNSNMYKYCLTGTVFKNSNFDKVSICDCDFDNVLIQDCVFTNGELEDLIIENNTWDRVKHSKMLWKDVLFSKKLSGSKFDFVVLIDTTMEECGGDDDSVYDIMISPYSYDIDYRHTERKETSPPARAETKSYTISYMPHIFVSEGLKNGCICI